jgi:hypothetical protein
VAERSGAVGVSASQKSLPRLAAAALILALLVVALAWFNYRFAAAQPGGSDFVPRWLGTRLLITQGLSPYSQEATAAIQEFFYGQPAPPESDQLLFVYPLYSVLLFAPYAMISDFALARATWSTTLQVALVLTALLGLQVVRWRPPPYLLTLLIIVGLLWYPAARALINGNPSVVASLSLVAGLWALGKGRDRWAAMFFAASTLKPQMVVLLLPLVILWALSVRRKAFIFSLAASLALLLTAATIIQSDWLLANVRQVLSYPGYTPPGSPPEIFALWWGETGRWLGWMLTAVLGALLLWAWRMTWAAGFGRFLWVALLTLTITNLIGLRTATDNHAALIVVVLVVLAGWDSWRFPYGRGAVLVALVTLLAGLWWLFAATLSGNYQHPIMFFPVPVLLILALLSKRDRCFCVETPERSGAPVLN